MVCLLLYVFMNSLCRILLTFIGSDASCVRRPMKQVDFYCLYTRKDSLLINRPRMQIFSETHDDIHFDIVDNLKGFLLR